MAGYGQGRRFGGFAGENESVFLSGGPARRGAVKPLVLKQLSYLLALARERHFGRAAAACNVSQPTLSAAIRALEEEFGAPIVERGHRFNGLTPEGEVVLGHAKRIMAECEALQQNLDALGHGLSGRLRLGAIPTALPIVSLLTQPFYARFPKVTIAALSMTSSEIQKGIDDFELDVGLTYLDNEPLSGVQARPLYAESYVFLTPTGGPFAHLKSIAWRDAAQGPLCLLTPDMQNRRIIDGVFRSVGVAPRPAVETNSIFNLCSHAAGGVWSSIVPRPLLQFFGLPEGATPVDLVEPDVTRTVGLIMADREPAAPLARALFAMAQPLDLDRLLAPPIRLTPPKG